MPILPLVPVLLAAPAFAQSPTTQAPVTPLVQTVTGIISFTRWPANPATISLCVVGAPDGAEALFAAPILVGSVPLRPRRASFGDHLEDCNALYVGRMSLSDRRQLNARLAGIPVLTMGEAAPDCIEFVMFCITVAQQTVTFSTNIDMIARGGIRLNPRVLLLGRRPPQ